MGERLHCQGSERYTDKSFYSCIFFVQAWPGRTKAICETLQTAAQTVKTILEAD